MDPVVPGVTPLPGDPETTQELALTPIFGVIENYGGITYLLTNYAGTDLNKTYIEKCLKSGDYTMSLTVTDEDTGITYFIPEYFFDVSPGNEIYGDWFFRFALGHYGITLENHSYTLKMDIYRGDKLLYTGTSATGAYKSTQTDNFVVNGAITPENIPHEHKVIGSAPTGDAAIYATIAVAVAAVALAVVFKKRATI